MLHWALTVVGLTTIITQSSLFAPLRQGFQRLTGSKFLGCPMCVGFWVGFGLSVVSSTFSVTGSQNWELGTWNMLLCSIVDGWASSGVCWITYVLLVKAGSKLL